MTIIERLEQDFASAAYYRDNWHITKGHAKAKDKHVEWWYYSPKQYRCGFISAPTKEILDREIKILINRPSHPWANELVWC